MIPPGLLSPPAASPIWDHTQVFRTWAVRLPSVLVRQTCKCARGAWTHRGPQGSWCRAGRRRGSPTRVNTQVKCGWSRTPGWGTRGPDREHRPTVETRKGGDTGKGHRPGPDTRHTHTRARTHAHTRTRSCHVTHLWPCPATPASSAPGGKEDFQRNARLCQRPVNAPCFLRAELLAEDRCLGNAESPGR